MMLIHSTSAFGQTFYSDLWGERGESWNPAGRLPDYSYAGYKAGESALPSPAVTHVATSLGAVGDDATDNWVAMQAALDSLPAHSVLLFPTGIYKFSRMLKIKRSDIIVRGNGASTIFKFTNSLKTLHSEGWSTFPNWHVGQGGLIWAGYPYGDGYGNHLGPQLTTINANADRLTTSIEVASASCITAGSYYIIKIAKGKPDGPVASPGFQFRRYLIAGGEATWSVTDDNTAVFGKDEPAWLLDFYYPVKVMATSGNLLTLAQPLPFKLLTSWNPVLLACNYHTEIGIENLKIEMPDVRMPSHLSEPGFNGIAFWGVLNGWVKNVTIERADNGIDLRECKHITLSGITLLPRSSSNNRSSRSTIQGHHGITLGSPSTHDCLLTDYNIASIWDHDVSINHLASGNVVRNGVHLGGTIDWHRNAPFGNLVSNVSFGDFALNTGTSGCYQSSGASAGMGVHAAAWNTYWNVTFSGGRIGWPGEAAPYGGGHWHQFAYANIVPCRTYQPGTSLAHWFIKTDTTSGSLLPSDLHESQLARRLGGQTTVPSR